MITYEKEKPMFYLNETECHRFNLPVKKDEEHVALYIPNTKKRKITKLYNREEELKDLPIYKHKSKAPIGHLTRSNASNYGIKVNREDKPVGIVKNGYKYEINALYDKGAEKEFLEYKEMIKEFRYAIQERKLPVYKNKERPVHLLPTCRMGSYFLDKSKKPVGVHISNGDRYYYIYDMTDELEKPLYSYGSAPIGYLTKEDMEELSIEFIEDEPPVAYTLARGKKPLYDRQNHPKMRLRVLTSTK